MEAAGRRAVTQTNPRRETEATRPSPRRVTESGDLGPERER